MIFDAAGSGWRRGAKSGPGRRWGEGRGCKSVAATALEYGEHLKLRGGTTGRAAAPPRCHPADLAGRAVPVPASLTTSVDADGSRLASQKGHESTGEAR